MVFYLEQPSKLTPDYNLADLTMFMTKQCSIKHPASSVSQSYHDISFIAKFILLVLHLITCIVSSTT